MVVGCKRAILMVVGSSLWIRSAPSHSSLPPHFSSPFLPLPSACPARRTPHTLRGPRGSSNCGTS
eukprot:7552416-Pyramimonas_sp.AAC.1